MGPLLLATTKSGCNVCPVSILPLLIMLIFLFTICQLAIIHYAIGSYKARNEAFDKAFKSVDPKKTKLQQSYQNSNNFSSSELNYFKQFEPVWLHPPNPSIFFSAHMIKWFRNDSDPYNPFPITHEHPRYKSQIMAEPLCPNTSAQLNHRVENMSITTNYGYFSKTNVATRRKVKAGGRFSPENCRPILFVAIIILYHDRISTNLNSFMLNLHRILQQHQFSYGVYVVEQSENKTFNKGALMNAGFLLALNSSYKQETRVDCVIFQDVDIILRNDNLYSCSSNKQPILAPKRKNAALENRMSSNGLVGRIFSILTHQLITVNGFSNYYWGDWEGGDDDMYNRLMANGIKVSRPNQSFSEYKFFQLGHASRKVRTHQYTPAKKLLKSSKLRFRIDGLSSIKFFLISTQVKDLYTRFLVDLGEPNTTWNSNGPNPSKEEI